MRPVVLQCRKGIKILQLSKSEESGGGDDIDTKDLGQAVMVKIERVLQSEKITGIGLHDPGVLNHIDVFGRPSCCDIGYDSLLQERPIAGEANEEWSRFVDMRSGRVIPWWNGRKVSWRCRRCCQREGVYDRCGSGGGARFMKRCRFDGRCRIFGASEWAGNAMAKASLCKDESSDGYEGENKNPEGASEQT